MAGAVYLVKFRGIAESATLYFFIQDASPRCDELGLASGRCKMTVFYPRMSSNRLYIGGSNSGNLRCKQCNLELKISWQAQYLVSSKGDFTCSAHWK